jgi:hypothetical protein
VSLSLEYPANAIGSCRNDEFGDDRALQLPLLVVESLASIALTGATVVLFVPWLGAEWSAILLENIASKPA